MVGQKTATEVGEELEVQQGMEEGFPGGDWEQIESNLRLPALCSRKSLSVPRPREILFQDERCDRPLKSTNSWSSLLASLTEDGKRIWELGCYVL